MCTMKEVCKEIGMNYETLKFYCKEGLVPNVKRDKNNYRNFDEKNIAWLKGIAEINECIEYIDNKQSFYDYVLEGKCRYTSNLIEINE